MKVHTDRARQAGTASAARATRLAILTCLVTVVALPAVAAEPQSGRPSDLGDLTLEQLLDIKVTTATRTPERLGDAPARVELVTADQIRRRGYRSLSEVLRDLPDFKVEVGADQDLPVDIVVQGIRDAGRIVVLLDGIRISSPTGEALPILANYPVHNARQIEVVYGPGSALYGADAFSAVVNIISRDADQAEGVSVSTSAGQFGLSNTTASYAARFGDDATVVVAGQYLLDRQPDLSRYYPSDFGSLEAQRTGVFHTIFGPMQSATPVPRDYANPISAHSVQATVKLGGLTLSLFQNASRVPTSPAYTPDNAVYSNEAYNRNTLVVTAATFTRDIGRVTNTTTLMFSRHELDPQSGYRNVYSNMDRSYKYAYGSMLKAEQQARWKLSRMLALTAGGTLERFFSIPQGADLNAPIRSREIPGTILGTDIPDDFVKLRYMNVGAYLQAQYAASPALTVTLGARGDHNTRYGSTFNPRLGLVWRPTHRSGIKLLYGTAFLAPSPYQTYSHYGSFYSTDGGLTYASSFWHLPNPDLRPQHKSTTELMGRHAIASGIDVWGSAFYSWYADIIREGPDPADRYSGFYHGWPVDVIEVSVNQDSQQIYGGSFGIDARRSFGGGRQIAGQLAVSLADGYVENGGARVEIGGMAPIQLQAGLDVGWDGWSLAPRLRVIGPQRVLATVVTSGLERRRTLDGYASLDFNVRRESVLKNVTVFARTENILDQRYRHINLRAYTNPEELLGAPQNPRRLTVGIEIRVP